MNLSAGILHSNKSNTHQAYKNNFDRLILEFFNEHQKIMETFSVNELKMQISFNEKIINLKKQKKIFEIINVFQKNQSLGLNRKDLISKIYPDSSLKEPSVRQLKCYEHNIIKLISRSRILLQHEFVIKMLK